MMQSNNVVISCEPVDANTVHRANLIIPQTYRVAAASKHRLILQNRNSLFDPMNPFANIIPNTGPASLVRRANLIIRHSRRYVELAVGNQGCRKFHRT